MKGIVVPVLIWGLACSPVAFAACRARRWIYLSAFGAVCALSIGLWIASAGYGYGLTENLTSSLNGHLYLHHKGEAFHRGDLVAYRWHGGATYPRGVTFIKQVIGMPGDLVRRVGNTFWVGEHYVGIAKPLSRAGVALEPAQEGVIGKDEFFLANPSPDSLDSRYALSGNIRRSEIIGRAYEIF